VIEIDTLGDSKGQLWRYASRGGTDLAPMARSTYFSRVPGVTQRVEIHEAFVLAEETGSALSPINRAGGRTHYCLFGSASVNFRFSRRQAAEIPRSQIQI
jgi:hypothetical protein